MAEHREHAHQPHAHQPSAHHAHAHFEEPEVAARLEREGEVVLELFDAAVTALVHEAGTVGTTIGLVVDVGCGPGVASCLLAERLPEARVVAADASAAMVARAAARASRLDVASRVDARVVPLPEGIGSLGRPDVIWASMVLHHVADELDALRRLRSALAPGGLLVLLERDRPARVLPEGADLGRPGLWARLDAALERWFADMRRTLPAGTAPEPTSAPEPTAAASTTAPGAYGALVAAAGFEVLVDEVLALHRTAALDADTEWYAAQQLQRLVRHLDGYADPDDLVELRAFIEHGLPAAELHAWQRLIVARR